MEGESGLTIVLRAAGSTRGGHGACGCCGRRVVSGRVRIGLRLDGVFHAEICPECVLNGPAGAAKVLRERIRERGSRSAGPLTRREAGAVRSWSGWMERRAAALERAGAKAFPLAARQAAVGELRERR
jgi:hypothetical protein